MIRRLMEYRASWVRMPARIAGIPHRVCSTPVRNPAIMPTRMAISTATHTLQPLRVSSTQTAPPVAREPSTVRSATSRIRYVIYTPMAITPQIMPWAAAPGMDLSKAAINSIGIPPNIE